MTIDEVYAPRIRVKRPGPIGRWLRERRGRQLLRTASYIRSVLPDREPPARRRRSCVCHEHRPECDCENADGIKRPRQV